MESLVIKVTGSKRSSSYFRVSPLVTSALSLENFGGLDPNSLPMTMFITEIQIYRNKEVGT